jgi:hypothetical protein
MSYCEVPDFAVDRYLLARKPHRCCECSAPIEKGEKHGHFTGKWDGVIRSFRQHLLCEKACVYIRDNFQGGECIGFGELKSHWAEYAKSFREWAGRPDRASEREKKFRKIMAEIFRRERPHSRSFRMEQARRRKCLREGRAWKLEESNATP